MDKPALQSLLWDEHKARVPSDDPIWLIPTLVDASMGTYAARIEAAAVRIEAAKTPLSVAEFDRLAGRLDKRFAYRIVQINRGLVLGAILGVLLAAGASAAATWWVVAPGPCSQQADLARGCYVRP